MERPNVGLQRLPACGQSAGMNCWASLPLEIWLAACGRTVSQIQINQALVGDSDVFRNRLEIVDALFVQADSYLLLELRGVRVLCGFRKIVFGAHGNHPVSRIWLLVGMLFVPR